MLSALYRRLRDAREDEGFTLIELMVVILIIAILLAIAIPTFLGARSRAQDRAAQSSLRNALTSADVAYANTNNYSQATSGGLASLEPALTFVASGTNSTGPNNISVNPITTAPNTDQQEWTGAALSKSGTCFYVRVVKVAGTGETAGTFYGQLASGATSCSAGATGATTAAQASWT